MHFDRFSLVFSRALQFTLVPSSRKLCDSYSARRSSGVLEYPWPPFCDPFLRKQPTTVGENGGGRHDNLRVTTLTLKQRDLPSSKKSQLPPQCFVTDWGEVTHWMPKRGKLNSNVWQIFAFTKHSEKGHCSPECYAICSLYSSVKLLRRG